MQEIRAHFDGQVFVPDEPVSLPPDCKVTVVVRSADRATAPAAQPVTSPLRNGVPVFPLVEWDRQPDLALVNALRDEPS